MNAATLEAKYQSYKQAQELLQAYKSIDPTDTEVDTRLAELSTLQAEEAQRKAEEEARQKAEEERKKRQQEKMKELETAVSALQTDKDALASCEAAIESGVMDMADMVLEQGLMVIEAQEIEMAGDVIPFVEDTQSQLNDSRKCVPQEAQLRQTTLQHLKPHQLMENKLKLFELIMNPFVY